MTHGRSATRRNTFVPDADNCSGPSYSPPLSSLLLAMYTRPVTGCTISASALRGPSAYVTVNCSALTVASASSFGSGKR